MARVRENMTRYAVPAAYAAWGKQHRNLIISGHIALRAAPWVGLVLLLAGLFGAVRWVAGHLATGTFAGYTFGGALIIAAVVMLVKLRPGSGGLGLDRASITAVIAVVFLLTASITAIAGWS
jgi:hypothetical protein